MYRILSIMADLKKYMPVTYATFLLQRLLFQVFPGSFGILSVKMKFYGYHLPRAIFIWLIGACTALFTAFYMFRLSFTYILEKRKIHHDHHPHESPKLMTIPLIVLAVLISNWRLCRNSCNIFR